ncbi:MAG: hypothetical protein ACP5M9_02670 [Candidatus Micrarchaeia archaeon]
MNVKEAHAVYGWEDVTKVINAISNATFAVKGKVDLEKSKNIAETVVKIR